MKTPGRRVIRVTVAYLHIWLSEKELSKHRFLLGNLTYFLLDSTIVKKESKKPLLDTASLCQRPALVSTGLRKETVTAAGRAGSLRPCSTKHTTAATASGPPRGFRGKRHEAKQKSPQKEYQNSSEFSQVMVSSKDFCSRYFHFWRHLLHLLIK